MGEETCEMIHVATDGEREQERVCGKPAVATVERSVPACAECARATEREGGIVVEWRRTSPTPDRGPRHE